MTQITVSGGSILTGVCDCGDLSAAYWPDGSGCKDTTGNLKAFIIGFKVLLYICVALAVANFFLRLRSTPLLLLIDTCQTIGMALFNN
jgi:hypothetical protein